MQKLLLWDNILFNCKIEDGHDEQELHFPVLPIESDVRNYRTGLKSMFQRIGGIQQEIRAPLDGGREGFLGQDQCRRL